MVVFLCDLGVSVVQSTLLEQNNNKLRPVYLNIEVEFELVGMRPHPNGVYFIQRLVLYPGFDDIFREHIAFEQKFVVFLKGF